jgi:ABC-type transport system involved in multi-copper enzyme maturation permease subunit
MALAWKEWREQRPLILAALGSAVAMPFFMIAGSIVTSRKIDVSALADIMPVIFASLLWPLFAAAAGGATFASEIGDGTLGYLLSRPVSRARIWVVKVAVAACSTLLILIGSLIFACLFGIVVAGGDATFLIRDLPRMDLAGLMTLVLVSATLLLFSASVFFSTFLSRAMNAAGAGLVTGLLIMAGIVLIWSRLDLIPRLEQGLLLIEIGLAGTVVLLASLYLFCRGELLGGSGGRKRGLLVGLASLAALAVVTVPAVWAQVRLSPAKALIAGLELDPSGEALFATAMAANGGSPEIWQIHADGSGIERLAGRLTFAPAVSSDGKWVAYLSMRGALGLRSDRAELRAMRTDGGDDHLVATAFNDTWTPYQGPEIAFSPDGKRVALSRWNQLVIAPFEGGDSKLVDLSKSPIGPARMVGWTADGSEILMLSSANHGASGSALGGVNAATGEIRLIYQTNSDRVYSSLMRHGFTGWKRFPLFIDTTPGEPGGWELALVDLRDGNAVRVNGSVCGLAANMSDDGKTLTYATCAVGPHGEFESELHTIDPEALTDRRIATLPGRAWSILMSPSKDRFLVHRFHSDNRPLPAALVSLDGGVTEIEEGWAPMGWQGRDRFILMRETPNARLAVGDVEGGAPRVFYP